METEDVYMGLRHEYGGETPFCIGQPERRQHVYVIGQTGTGKSTLLRNMLMQDIEAGRGVALIDPHGDLASDVLEQIPPWRTSDVVYFDPASRDPLAINLFRATGDNWHLVAAGIVSAFKKIWANSWGTRLEYILHATLAALLQCDQISTAVFGNVGTLLAFRVSEADGSILERQFGGTITSSVFTGLDNYEICARMLSRDPFRARSLEPLDTGRRRRRIVIRHSRQKYCTRGKVIEDRIDRWLKKRH